MVRPSLEAFGFDISKTAKELLGLYSFRGDVIVVLLIDEDNCGCINDDFASFLIGCNCS